MAKAATSGFTSTTVTAFIVVALAAAGATDPVLAVFAVGWLCVYIGMWILFNGSNYDPFLLVDSFHAILSIYTFGGTIPFRTIGGTSGLTDESIMLLHISYHVVTVTVAAALFGPEKWFGEMGLMPKLYTAAAWLSITVDRSIRLLDPSLTFAALFTTKNAADLYNTPWHWCLYSLAGGGPRAATLPIVSYTAYCSIRNLYMYPTTMYPAVVDLLNSTDFADASSLARALFCVVPAFNFCIMGFVLTPRIAAAFRDAKALTVG
jgi:hypothetical protein